MSLQSASAEGVARPVRRSGAPARRNPPQQRKPTDVRTREILDVAARLFAERGYAETTMRNICAAVGLTLGSLYYHVESKEAVLVHIVTDTGGPFVEDMRRLCEQDVPVVDCAYAVARRWMYEVHHYRDQWRVVMREQWRIRGPQYREVLDLRRETEVLIERLLERGIHEGTIRPHDVRLTSMAIAGLMNSTLQWYQPGARLEPETIADHYMTLVLRGIVTQEVHARLPLGTRALSADGRHAERRRDGS
jgi:AcrR family transcriptional regulator